MKNIKTSFEDRLAAHHGELRALYRSMYHDEEAFTAFCDMLKKSYNGRRLALKELDTAREKEPGWYEKRELLGMQMSARDFGGTLNGLREHLDYLRETKVNLIHIVPLLQSDRGYAVSDFRKIESGLGSMNDLSQLADVCHAEGILLGTDLVMHCTSEDHAWAERARGGDEACQDRYFFYDDPTVPEMFERTLSENENGNFTLCEETGKQVMTSYRPDQWDLNYANPVVFNDMTENMLFLCNKGMDVIRLDGLSYIWKTLGTDCRNQPQVHTLLRLLRLTLEIVCPGTLLLGKVDIEPEKAFTYYGTEKNPECHMLYDDSTMATIWHTVATHDARLLRHRMEGLFALPKDRIRLNYLRCRDGILWNLDYEYLKQFGADETEHKVFLNDYFRGYCFGSDAHGELYVDNPRLRDGRLCGTTASLCGVEGVGRNSEVWRRSRGIRLVKMLHALLLTQSGVPVLYSGDEIGRFNDYSYRRDPLRSEDCRNVHRGAFDWSDAEKRTDPNERQGAIYGALAKLEENRREYAVFNPEARCWTLETDSRSILGLGRYYKGEKLIALFNFSPDEQTARIHEPEDYVNLMSGESCGASDIRLPGYGFVWLMTEFKKAD